MYGAYFDESDESPGFSLAGFSASYSTWVALYWKWQALLADWKVKYFKASECENLLGQFAQYRDCPSDLKSTLGRHERDRMVEIKTQFIDAICGQSDDLQGYGATVALGDFDRLICENAKARRYLRDKPYYICFQLCMVAAATPAREVNKFRRSSDRIYIKPIFDSHEEYSGMAKEMFDQFVKKNPLSGEVLFPVDYEDDVTTIPLQVADTLAYEARKFLTMKIRDPLNKYMRPPMIRLLPFVRQLYRLDYDSLKLIVDKQTNDSIPISPVSAEDFLEKE
jgi:hypothetical protein